MAISPYLHGIHTKGHGCTGALHTLVVTRHTRQLEGLIGQGRHGVVRQALVGGISHVVGHEQQDGSSRHAHGPVPWDLDATDDRVAAVELDLEAQPTAPDDAVEEHNQDGRDQRTLAPAKGEVVRQLADDDGPYDLADTLEQGDQGAGAAVEQAGGDGALVAVKVVGREEHGEQGDHAPVAHQLPQLGELAAGRDSVLELDDGAVGADDGVGREQEPRGHDGGEHNNQEGEVDARRDAG